MKAFDSQFDLTPFGHGLFAGFDDSLSSDSVIDRRKWRSTFSQAFLHEVSDFFPNVPTIGRPGMGMNDSRFILDPVAIAKTGGPICTDDFDDEGPGIRRMIVGGEIGAKMRKRAGFQSQVHHGEVFSLKFVVVNDRFYSGHSDGRVIGLA
jgi:hypothetical protein